MFHGFYYQAHSEVVRPVIREAAAVTIAAVFLQALPAKVFPEAEDISAEAELQAAGKAKKLFLWRVLKAVHYAQARFLRSPCAASGIKLDCG